VLQVGLLNDYEAGYAHTRRQNTRTVNTRTVLTGREGPQGPVTCCRRKRTRRCKKRTSSLSRAICTWHVRAFVNGHARRYQGISGHLRPPSKPPSAQAISLPLSRA
jgi:hypothetical protein